MNVTRTVDGHADIVLTAEELTALAVEALAASGAAIFRGDVRARLSVFRTGLEDRPLLFRLAVRPEPLAEQSNLQSAGSSAAPSSPIADPAPDVFTGARPPSADCAGLMLLAAALVQRLDAFAPCGNQDFWRIVGPALGAMRAALARQAAAPLPVGKTEEVVL